MASYRFGTLEVRPAERRVLAAGEPAALGARAFDLLVALIENRDRVMSKDELMALVWPGVVVEENNLQVQVSTLRKLFGAEAISTLPGRGYRFTLSPDAMAAPTDNDVRRHNLPAELNTFVGRESEIDDVGRLLATSRLVTLTGVGGTGKTRLSLHVAAALLPGLADGAWLVELAPVSDERHVTFAIASALGVPDGDLAGFLRQRQVLVILDNCEHLLHGCAAAARRLMESGEGVRILASSREPLRVAGEATFRVPPLARAQAIQLFVERARAANPAFEPAVETSQAVVEICKRLDGLPLAIELAAARVRALSVGKIAERLDDRFRLLAGGDPTAMPRQQTLRASIDWSYELLSASERAVMRRLAVFAGGWTLEAAEAVCGGGEVEQASTVLELLAGLVDKSLVAMEADGSRYHLLETVREFALEQLEAAAEGGAIRNRHVQHFIEFSSLARLELVGSDQAAWFRRVDTERENILAAHRWCEASGQAVVGLRLISSLKGYWINRGLVAIARGMMMSALATVRERGRQRARTLYDVGQMGYFMGLFTEARAQLEECLGIAREVDDKVLAGLALQPLGLACAGAGDPAAARPYLEEAIALAREQQEPRRVAAAAIALAQLHRAAGELSEAEPLYEHAVALARDLNDPVVVAIGQLNLAMAAADKLRAARARDALDEALGIARSTGSKPLGQSVLEVCAGLAATLEDWSSAAGFYGAAEAEAGRTGLRRDPADEAFLGPRIERARRACGGTFTARERWGRDLSYDEALDEAASWLRRVAVTG